MGAHYYMAMLMQEESNICDPTLLNKDYIQKFELYQQGGGI
jgi:hypothetical protein